MNHSFGGRRRSGGVVEDDGVRIAQRSDPVEEGVAGFKELVVSQVDSVIREDLLVGDED